MRFICTEFNTNTNDLYRKEPIDQSVIPEGEYLLTKSNKIDNKEGILFSYTNDIIRKILFTQLFYDRTLYTPSAWLIAKGITGTDHTSITNSFDWQGNSCAELQSNYFYTILSEDGLHFALPQRISTSVEIINYTYLSEYTGYETDYSFDGESGYTFTIGASRDETVIPNYADSELKSKAINKYKSKQNVLTIQSGYNAKPLDYVQYKGAYYILISRTELQSGLYMYTCVREYKDINTFSGIDITMHKSITRPGSMLAYLSVTQTTSSTGGLAVGSRVLYDTSLYNNTQGLVSLSTNGIISIKNGVRYRLYSLIGYCNYSTANSNSGYQFYNYYSSSALLGTQGFNEPWTQTLNRILIFPIECEIEPSTDTSIYLRVIQNNNLTQIVGGTGNPNYCRVEVLG